MLKIFSPAALQNNCKISSIDAVNDKKFSLERRRENFDHLQCLHKRFLQQFGSEFFDTLQCLKRFYNDFEAPHAKIITIYSTYIRYFEAIWSAAGEKIFTIYSAHIRDYNDFGAPQARKFWEFTEILQQFWRRIVDF